MIFLNQHSELGCAHLIPKEVGGIRLDWYPGQTPLEVEERLNHYKDFSLRLLVSRYDHAVIANSRWKGKLHIHFKNEPEYKHHDFTYPEEYAVLVRSLKARGVPVWGPCLSDFRHVEWWRRFKECGGVSVLVGVDVHGYSHGPERLGDLVKEIRADLPRGKPLCIGEYGPQEDFSAVPEFLVSAIRHVPTGIDINLYRGPDPANEGNGLFHNGNYSHEYRWREGVRERWDKAVASSVRPSLTSA